MPMKPRYYLAYGSNLHPLRLQERTPSARLHGVTTLRGYRLAWHKRGDDGSGKCDLIETARDGDRVHGALFTLDAADRLALDRFEGEGYSPVVTQVHSAGLSLSCFFYLANTTHIDPELPVYDWYQQLVLMGARYHGFPRAYIEDIHQTVTREDPDPERRALRQELLRRLEGA